jgi:hypothetical protein
MQQACTFDGINNRNAMKNLLHSIKSAPTERQTVLFQFDTVHVLVYLKYLALYLQAMKSVFILRI